MAVQQRHGQFKQHGGYYANVPRSGPPSNAPTHQRLCTCMSLPFECSGEGLYLREHI